MDQKKEYKKKTIPKALKRMVWDKHIGEDIGKSLCKCCNLTAITQMSFHCGHILAEANGGETNIDNLLPICELCNKSMGTTNLLEFKKKMETNDLKVSPIASITYEQSIMKLAQEQPIGPHKTIMQQSIITITANQKYKLKILLEKSKKCIRLFYLNSGKTEMEEYRKWSLVATGGDETPYKLIYNTYNNFYDVVKKDNCIEYLHKKCNTIFKIDTFNESSKYDQKIKQFINHINCLLNDDEYIMFCDKCGFLK